jgi:KDO2-lipid IV(A) lauroyltransferase
VTEPVLEYPDAARKKRAQEIRKARPDLNELKKKRRKARYRRRARRMPVVRAAARVMGWLPVGVAAFLGECFGALIHVFARSSRQRVMFQLQLAFPERSASELRGIARRMFRLMGRGVASLPAIRRRGVAELMDRIEVENLELLEEALEGGKGAIVVTYHYGLFEAGGAWLAHNMGGVAVGKDLRTNDTQQVLVEIRRDLGLATIERGDARAIVRALRDNHPVAILADHDVDDVNGAFVPFFGHLAHTPIGPAALSVRTGAPIVPVVNIWDGRTRYRGRFLGLLRAREDLPKDERVHELTYRFTKLGEDAIRDRPDHWLWLHKRWWTRPENRPDLPVWEPPRTGPDGADA